MNTNPELSTGLAIFMSLFAAFLWGTWFISVKYIGNYPLDGFFFTLVTFAIVFVWTVGFLLDGSALVGNIVAVFTRQPGRLYVTLLCGSLYIIGIRVSLYVFQLIGLSLSQPIQASINILLGTLISGVIGGMPSGSSVSRIAVACLFLLGAVIATIVAGKFRTQAQKDETLRSNLRFSMKDMWVGLGLLAFASMLIPTYPLGLSYGLKSVIHPDGFAVLPFMAVLTTGAWIGGMICSGSVLTIRHQWMKVWKAPFSIHKFGIMSGLFHVGGNIIHAFATASLSPVISWPLGFTLGLWTQMWGIVYGEFKGAPKKTFVALGCALIFYFIGSYLIAIQA